MFVCMLRYVYACMHVCRYVCMHTSLCVSMASAYKVCACMFQNDQVQVDICVCWYVYVYVCMHACMNICMYVCMYACIQVWALHLHTVCVRMCLYVCMYWFTYVCVYVNIYMSHRWRNKYVFAQSVCIMFIGCGLVVWTTVQVVLLWYDGHLLSLSSCIG